MSSDNIELKARMLADILNEANVRPHIMGMPTFVALTTEEWELTWSPREGWMAQERLRAG